MFGKGFGRSLRGLDFYGNTPSQYAEGTISGACISIISITTLIVLSGSAISSLMSPITITDLVLDVKHSQDKLNVTLDIEFYSFPCALMSVDIQNVLRVHDVNIRQGLVRHIVPSGEVYDDQGMPQDQISVNIRKQMDEKTGCRVVGQFEIDRVPGNFHFSTHGYAGHMNEIFKAGLRKFDMSHKIHALYFGNERPRKSVERTLEGFKSEKEIPEQFLGITYAYFLEIVEKNSIYSNGTEPFYAGFKRETFFYTVRINELMLPSIPMVMFRYQTNPMTQLDVGEYQSWNTFFIELVAIIGGIFTVSSIVDQMVHSSIRYLVEKQLMGKLA